jgi:hypothetical protein
MTLRTLAVAGAVLAMSVPMFGQGPRRDGRWEVSIQMNMPGMQMPAMTTTQCITKEEASDPMKSVPQGPNGRGGMPSNCKMGDYKTEGNTVTFSMKCDAPQAATMTGEFVYGDGTYEGTMKMDMDRGGQPMSMTMKYSGKRLGDCTK